MDTEDKVLQKEQKKKIDISIYLKKAKNLIKKMVKKIKNVKKIKIDKNYLKYAILAIGIVLVIMGLSNILFSGGKVPYPIIFNTSEGDLMLIDSNTKGDPDEAVKLAVGESVSSVLYANTTERYVLFKKNNDLYLYDKEDKDETTKILENVSSFKFSKDDKYIVTLDKDENLSVYNYKKSTKIESDVSKIIDVTDEKIIFEKDNVVYIRSINPKKDNRERITAELGSTIKVSENGKNVIYLNKDNDLVFYNTKNNKDYKISSNVKKFICDKSSCEKLFFIEISDEKTIFYYDGNKTTKVAEGIFDILDADVEHKQVVYSTVKEGTYTIYFQVVGKESFKVEEKLSSIRVLRIFEGKEIYYITGKNEVKYGKISGNSVDKTKSLGTDVTGFLNLYNDGYAFVSDVDTNSNGTLYFAKNGKAKKVDTNVNSTFIKVNKKGNKVYYFKDYDTLGTLYVTSGSKNTKIDELVYNFSYIDDDLIYYIKDYSNTKSRGDLFIYRNGKSFRIYEGVSRIKTSN